MKKIAVPLALLLFTALPSAAQSIYGWTLSDSPSDPRSNTGVAPALGVATLYLWLEVACVDGVAAAEFDIAPPAGSSVLAFTQMNGFLNAGGPSTLLLATPCAFGPVAAGSVLVLDVTPGDYCLVPSAANGKNVSVDCTNFLEWNNDTIGYNNSGAQASCSVIIDCGLSLEDRSWGTLKVLYR